MIEYRVCWAASTNISFRGETEWTPSDDEATTEDQAEEAALADGLEEALEASGFEWWIETRESEADSRQED